MGIQVVVKVDTDESIESALGNIASQCEIFPIKDGYFGLSIPRKVVDSVGENNIEAILATLEYFDLWEGAWKKASK